MYGTGRQDRQQTDEQREDQQGVLYLVHAVWCYERSSFHLTPTFFRHANSTLARGERLYPFLTRFFGVLFPAAHSTASR